MAMLTNVMLPITELLILDIYIYIISSTNKVAVLVYLQNGILQIGFYVDVKAVLPLLNYHFQSIHVIP